MDASVSSTQSLLADAYTFVINGNRDGLPPIKYSEAGFGAGGGVVKAMSLSSSGTVIDKEVVSREELSVLSHAPSPLTEASVGDEHTAPM
jgi:hypothetical protein